METCARYVAELSEKRFRQPVRLASAMSSCDSRRPSIANAVAWDLTVVAAQARAVRESLAVSFSSLMVIRPGSHVLSKLI
jgi:hypothetical protein